MEMYGYKCTLQTDTEVIAYMFDYLSRKVGLTCKEIAEVLAAPFWQTIAGMDEGERARLTYLRQMFSSQLITGPFSIIAGFTGGVMALNDRLKLRSMVVAEKGDVVYIASEECAIRAVTRDVDRIYAPRGGEAVVYTLNEGVN
jgi:glutamate synthase domain-containing protein 1